MVSFATLPPRSPATPKREVEAVTNKGDSLVLLNDINCLQCTCRSRDMLVCQASGEQARSRRFLDFLRERRKVL